MIKMYIVGGAVRDRLCNINLGTKFVSKDVDFAVGEVSYEEMKNYLMRYWDVRIVQEDRQFVRLKAAINVVRMFESYEGRAICSNAINTDGVLYADFVLCRKDGAYQDGRHPSYIEPSDILTDLSRRDLTINSIAYDITGQDYIDPHNGIKHIKERLLSFVGNPLDRIVEDYLRVIRLFRFWGVLSSLDGGWAIGKYDFDAIKENSNIIAAGIKTSVSNERVYGELLRMAKVMDVNCFLNVLNDIPEAIRNAMFNEQCVWLKPSMEHRGDNKPRQNDVPEYKGSFIDLNSDDIPF